MILSKTCPNFWYINQNKDDSSVTVTNTGKAHVLNFQYRRVQRCSARDTCLYQFVKLGHCARQVGGKIGQV